MGTGSSRPAPKKRYQSFYHKAAHHPSSLTVSRLPAGITSGRIDLLCPHQGITVGPAVFRFSRILEAVIARSPYPVIQLPGGGTITYTDLSWVQIRLTAQVSPGSLPVDTVLLAVLSLLRDLIPATDLQCGTVEDAWCPGFTDISFAGQKLAGVGILSRGPEVTANVTFSTLPVPKSIVETLDHLHLILGKHVLQSALTSLSECIDETVEAREAGSRLLACAASLGYTTGTPEFQETWGGSPL